MKFRQILHLRRHKLAVRRNKSQIGDKTVGCLIHMGRKHHASKALHQLPRPLKRNRRSVNKEILHRPADCVLRIINQLSSEDLLLIWKCHKTLIHISVKIHSRLKLLKQTHSMDLLRCVDLHPRNGKYPVLLCPR